MNATEITGWIFDSNTFCLNCCNEDWYNSEPHLSRLDPPPPIFAGHEYDQQPYCYQCCTEIFVTLIEPTEASDTDLHYYNRAMDLIATARGAAEEAQSRIDGIKYKPLRERAQEEFDDRL